MIGREPRTRRDPAGPCFGAVRLSYCPLAEALGFVDKFDGGWGFLSSMIFGVSSMICWASLVLGRLALVGPAVVVAEFDDLDDWGSVGGMVVIAL